MSVTGKVIAQACRHVGFRSGREADVDRIRRLSKAGRPIRSPTTKVLSVIALIFSIATFFSRLFPIIRKMELEGELTVNGYSRTLAIMIGSFIAVFAAAVAVYLIRYLR